MGKLPVSRRLLASGLYLGILGIPLSIGLVPAIWLHDTHTLSVMGMVLNGAVHGRFSGCYQGRPNRVDFGNLLPGDILLCHDVGGGYGYYTHCALYVGDGQVVESANFREGTQVVPIDVFHRYDEVRVMRVRCPTSMRIRAVAYAQAQVDKGYSLFGGLFDPRSMYCSKLVWDSYGTQGLKLCPTSRWIIPDDLAASTDLEDITAPSTPCTG